MIFENDYLFGDGVNIASRIQALATPGGIWMSEAVHNNVVNKNDIDTEFVKVEHLKNVKEPVRIYQVKVEGVIALDTNKAALTNIKIKNRRIPVLISLGVIVIFVAGYFIYKNQRLWQHCLYPAYRKNNFPAE